MIKLTAFRSVPPFAQGLVRDLRVRWALEEAGIPYQERLVSGAEERATAAYRNRQGELIIRQRAAFDADHDSFVYVAGGWLHADLVTNTPQEGVVHEVLRV